MTVAISNMYSTFANTTIRYDAIGMDVNTFAYASGSNLINLKKNGTSQFVVDANGRVGIGTTVPSQRLDVRDPTNPTLVRAVVRNANTAKGSSSDFVAFSNNNTEYVQMASFAGDGGYLVISSNNVAVIRALRPGLVTPGIPMYFQTNNATQMIISETGNVGIGTTNPTSLLDVAGSANISGNIIVYGDVSILGNSFIDGVVNSAGYLLNGFPIGAVDYKSFSVSGTWTKPSSGTIAYIQAWGGGASGARFSGSGGGGGGGGSYTWRIIRTSSLTDTVTVTIGAGGASRSGSNQNGAPGGNTTFGGYLTAYGGTGGTSTGGIGGGFDSAGTGSSDEYFGGGAGGSPTSTAGQNRFLGAGGGGGCTSAGVGGTGGQSRFGGDGGAGGVTASPGTEPGGGGGGATTTSGAGANGRVIVIVW